MPSTTCAPSGEPAITERVACQETVGADWQSRTVAKHEGRLELTWTDKDKALLSTGDGRYDYTFVDPSDRRVAEVRLLHEVERVEADTPADRPAELPTPTTDNLLITGDAMHVLDALTKIPEYSDRYLGKVKLVYIDPPFNTGQAFTNYEDNIEHSIWLTMLRDRLRQIKPLLAADASVWVHLDDAEVHRCRLVMDEELGAENFVAEVVWEKADSPNNSARYLSKDQDYVLVYAKSKATWTPFRLRRNASSDAHYSNPDGDPRGLWYPGDPYANKPYSLGLYEVVGPTGRTFRPPPGRFWRISQAKFHEFEAAGKIYWGPDGKARPSIKRFLSEVSGLTPRTLWRHTEVGSNRTSKNEMRALFPGLPSFATPKPERFMERVLEIASQPGDIVLDCFAGSGTTAAVAQKLGRRWVTSELLSETLDMFTKPRLRRVVNGDDDGGITSTATREAAEGLELPEGMTAAEAQEFTRLLNKLTKSDGVEIDDAVLKSLRSATRTRDVTTVTWHGGGGFTHLQVGPSMFEEIAGMVVLAEWATQGALSEAMCAQLGTRYVPEGVFAGRHGRRRLAVIDGMVGATTIDAIVEQLVDRENVEVWATQIDDGAAARLKELRPGSRLHRIPSAVLDTYRRRKAERTPFGGHRNQEGED